MTEVASRLMDRCRGRGVRRAEVYIKTGETRVVGLDSGGSVNWTRTAEGGIGLRVFLDSGAAGFASICGPHAEHRTLEHLVDAALDAARGPATIFPMERGRTGDGRGLGIFDPRLHTATPADLEGLLDDAASEALRIDPRARRLDTASIAASSSRVWIRNSEGLDGSYKQTLMHLSLGVVAEDAGHLVVVRQSRTARSLSAFSPALFGDQTARLAATALEGRPPRPGRFQVLLGPAAAAEILRHYARALPAPGPPEGTPVASAALTIIDDGRLPGGTASAPFDGEGVATRRTGIVLRGRFGAMIHDLASAARHDVESTGNGVRMSFRDPPQRMISNLFIAPGSDEPADLLAGMDEGIQIESLRPTTALVNRSGSGDGNGSEEDILAAVGTGRWVRSGRLQEAITGALLIAPLGTLLNGVVGIGNDLTFGFPAGSFGAPSLLIDEVEIRAPWT